VSNIKDILDAKAAEARAAMTELLGAAPSATDLSAAVETMNAMLRPSLPENAPRPGEFAPKVKMGTVDANIDRSVCTESEIEFLDAEPE